MQYEDSPTLMSPLLSHGTPSYQTDWSGNLILSLSFKPFISGLFNTFNTLPYSVER